MFANPTFATQKLHCNPVIYNKSESKICLARLNYLTGLFKLFLLRHFLLWNEVDSMKKKLISLTLMKFKNGNLSAKNCRHPLLNKRENSIIKKH